MNVASLCPYILNSIHVCKDVEKIDRVYIRDTTQVFSHYILTALGDIQFIIRIMVDCVELVAMRISSTETDARLCNNTDRVLTTPYSQRPNGEHNYNNVAVNRQKGTPHT